MLLGTGRAPYTASLGLDTTQVRTDANGFIQINGQLQTAEHNIYEIGYCCSPEMTANQALADAGELIHLLGASSEEPIDARVLAKRCDNHPARAEEVLNAVETMVSKWGMGA